MDTQDVLTAAEHSPAQLISVHMEAVNHWNLSRKNLQAFAQGHNFSDRLHTPADGELLIF